MKHNEKGGDIPSGVRLSGNPSGANKDGRIVNKNPSEKRQEKVSEASETSSWVGAKGRRAAKPQPTRLEDGNRWLPGLGAILRRLRAIWSFAAQE
jgi:hypothetical protein